MGDIFRDSLFIFDWATCNNYFDWFHEGNKSAADCRALYDTHIASVMAKLNQGKPIVIISNESSEKLTRDYASDRALVVDTFLEGVEIRQISDGVPQVISLIKLYGISDVTKKKVYIVASDSYTYNELKVRGQNVINLHELAHLLKKE